MSPLEPLAPDQRAVVSLVLQQGRSYEEIAALLGMPVDAVRERAQAGLAALAGGGGLPPEITAPLADFLLGQQSEVDAEATRGLLAASAPARAWASDVGARLEEVAPGGLPEIPGGAGVPADNPAGKGAGTAGGAGAPTDNPAGKGAATAAGEAVPAPRPRPVRETAPPAASGDAPPASSRLGGALLIGGVLVVVALVLVFVLRGGDDDPSAEVAATPTPTATATPEAPQAEVADTIQLRSTTGGDPKGTMTLYLQEQQLLFALEAQDVPASAPNAAYAVWFTGPGTKARRLGFTNPVGEDGQLGIQGPSDKDLDAFPKLYATYERVVVSEETSEDAKHPGKVILSGRLPGGR